MEEDKYTKKLLEKASVEAPAHMKAHIMSAILKANEKKGYKPILRKESWFIMAAVLAGVILSVFFTGNDNTQASEIPLYSTQSQQLLDFINNISGFFSQIKLSYFTIFSFFFFWFFLFIDEAFGKKLQL